MALRYLLDENERGALWSAILRHNASSVEQVDAERVGDPVDLPLGTGDPEVLRWAEREGYVVITRDYRTMPRFLLAHLSNGGHLPGMFVIRRGSRLRDVLNWLVMASDTGDDDQWRDQFIYIP
jgi:Domain of unknown function (DUF5615)